jgi:hypothetical protein
MLMEAERNNIQVGLVPACSMHNLSLFLKARLMF